MIRGKSVPSNRFRVTEGEAATATAEQELTGTRVICCSPSIATPSLIRMQSWLRTEVS